MSHKLSESRNDHPSEPLAAPPGRVLASEAWITKPDGPVTAHGVQAGPLSGLCFAVKDNIDVEGLPTTAACPAFAHTASQSATVVQLLLRSGASLVGKTNLDQFACGLNGTRSPYGSVPNAFNPAYVSGGSSSGSAYVVATGQVDFALGTDTAGSGRVPAGLNNVVGLKPSRGLISTAGVLPAAQSVDVVSIMARSVPMAWRVLVAAMGHDPADPFSRTLTLRDHAFPQSFRFGVPSQLEFFGDEQASAAFEQAVQRLQGMGGQAVPIDYAPLARVAELLYGSALVAERYAAIREFFDAHEQEVIEPVRSIIAAGRHYQAADVFDARARLQALAQHIQPMWASIDTLLVPTAPTHYTIEAMSADPMTLNRHLGYYTNFVNLLDYAALSVPSSIRPDGLPFGVTFIGPCGSDWALAELGARFHSACDLPLGSTSERLSQDEQFLPPMQAPGSTVRVAVVGAHLSGMPLNGQLLERGARLLQSTRTASCYRLFALAATHPPKPGLLRVRQDEGAAIDVEVWEMPLLAYGSFVSLIPAPLGIGSLTLESGQAVQGFLCEAQALQGAQDISHFGGWRAYLASLGASSTR